MFTQNHTNTPHISEIYNPPLIGIIIMQMLTPEFKVLLKPQLNYILIFIVYITFEEFMIMSLWRQSNVWK